MQEVLLTGLSSAIAAAVSWFFTRRFNKAEAKLKEAEAKLKELEASDASVAIYEKLLDNAAKRLNEQIALNEKQSQEINTLLKNLKERDEKVNQLLADIELMTGELRKYKQLNGKHV
jgi:DNA repair exonuclease SbcCD ATPase subunit